MENFNASKQWGENKKITALQNPISEFNARGGLDLEDYQAFEKHLENEHPDIGKEDWEKTRTGLPTFELVEDRETGQKIRIQKFNWPADNDVTDQTVTFMNMPFSVAADPDHIQYEHFLVAKELGTPFVVFENPGYGQSDKLTKLQSKDLKVSGDFSSIARPMLGIAKELGTNNANFIGYSMGAETAAAMAANAVNYGIAVDNLFVMESPGVEVHEPVKLARDFMSDANNLKFTWKHPADPVLREVGKLKPALPHGTLSYGRAMVNSNFENSLRVSLITQPQMDLTLASAGDSKISPLQANNRIYDKLRSVYQNRVHRVIIPGEGHAYGDSGQRFASLTRLILQRRHSEHAIPEAEIVEESKVSLNDSDEKGLRKRLQRPLGNLALKRLKKAEKALKKAEADQDFYINHDWRVIDHKAAIKRLSDKLDEDVEKGNISQEDRDSIEKSTIERLAEQMGNSQPTESQIRSRQNFVYLSDQLDTIKKKQSKKQRRTKL